MALQYSNINAPIDHKSLIENLVEQISKCTEDFVISLAVQSRTYTEALQIIQSKSSKNTFSSVTNKKEALDLKKLVMSEVRSVIEELKLDLRNQNMNSNDNTNSNINRDRDQGYNFRRNQYSSSNANNNQNFHRNYSSNRNSYQNANRNWNSNPHQNGNFHQNRDSNRNSYSNHNQNFNRNWSSGQNRNENSNSHQYSGSNQQGNNSNSFPRVNFAQASPQAQYMYLPVPMNTQPNAPVNTGQTYTPIMNPNFGQGHSNGQPNAL
jgi:hypothetical protein